MQPLRNLRQMSWLLILWFGVVGLGLLGGLFEFSGKQVVLPTISATPTPTLEPALILTNNVPPPYTAQAIWLLDRTTDSLLYSDRSNVATSVASLAKLMTALVAYDTYNLQDELTIGSAAGVLGNRAKFLPRDRFSVADLLRAMLVFSANDAAQTLANGLWGNDLNFIRIMNERAQQMGLRNTHFINSLGLDDAQQYSTAADIGQIANTVLSIPFLEDIVAQQQVLVHEKNTGRTDTIYSTNVLLRRNNHYRGVKTGTTEGAGENLVVRYLDQPASLSGQLDLLLVILGSRDRYGEAQSLIQWVLHTIAPNPRANQTFSP